MKMRDVLIRTVRHNKMCFVNHREEVDIEVSNDLPIKHAQRILKAEMPRVEQWEKRTGRRGAKPVVEVWMLVATSEK